MFVGSDAPSLNRWYHIIFIAKGPCLPLLMLNFITKVFFFCASYYLVSQLFMAELLDTKPRFG